MCVALAGNILALWLLVTKERKNWHMGVVFSCNLIISDIFYAVVLPLRVVYYSKGQIPGYRSSLFHTQTHSPKTCQDRQSVRLDLCGKHFISNPLLFRKLSKMNKSNCGSTFSNDLLAPIYSVEMCVALAGNILALWLLVNKEKKKWNMGLVFSCNLIISDIFYALSLPLLIDYYSKGQVWIFGEAVCKIERFLFTCNLYVSIYFIMCISVHRYLAIVPTMQV
ncbi:hypothetical protein KOW79_019583 [Hemibagrus wyckioides]|uniref:G-protein coupled receptors family 1 profile domain-containing protein n=1 Tax=Hemibagrus wyckioides TaxID=337641 RepID=A0A9D3SBA7_9TELE|nr:hypothetical protein KOW79_019583 [Hemibagrus wyckioides]